MTLHIAADLGLPDDYVTKTAAILAQRRKGKTYTASVIAEEMLQTGIPFVALDPTGAWWGLRASADGQGPGLPVVVLGGDHGDVPLDRTDGKGVAELVVDEPGWYVIDFSLFESNAAEVHFAADFAQRLYRRKGQPNSDFPLHLFVDEADRFVPQRPARAKGEGAETVMLGAFEAIVRRGGLRGLGATLISQRSAVVNKNVLEQADLFIILRTVGPNDRQRIEEIVSANGTAEQLAEMKASIASLGLGEAWVWEPGEELFQRVRIRQRDTFNSSATPKPGEKRVEPRQLAAVDLEAIKERWSTQLERAKADDPAHLRKEIARLERELKQRPTVEPEVKVETVVERVEVPVLDEALVGRVERALTGAADFGRSVIDATDSLLEGLATMRTVAQGAHDRLQVVQTSRAAAPARQAPKERPQRAVQRPRQPAPPSDASIGGGAPMKVLTALGHYPTGCPKARVAMLAGIGQKKSTLRNALSELRTAGYITGTDPLYITDSGLAALGDLEPLPTGAELLAHWRGQLNPSEQACLDVLMEDWPEIVDRVELAERADLDPEKSTLRNAMSRLRVLGLASGWRANDDFMESIG